MSRSNDATIDVRPSPAPKRPGRSGPQRQPLAGRRDSTPDTNRLAAERLTDNARAVFDADYLKEHVTLGYAATVHSAQGVTADSSYAILGEGASRAMAYVAMTRGRHNNEAFLYQKFSQEADHEHAKPVAAPAIHQLRRGNKYSAAYYFRQILGNDDRPRTMHAEAERTERHVASRGGRRGDSTPRGTPPRPPHRVAGPREDGPGVASRSRTHGRRSRNPRRRHRSRRRRARAVTLHGCRTPWVQLRRAIPSQRTISGGQ